MRKPRPYIDRGKPGLRYQRGGALFMMQHSPPVVEVRRLKLEEIQRRNSLAPELQDTHRIFLRWSEGEGSGLPNPEAETREMHYDPLPLEVQERVSAIVASSPWEKLICKLYFGTADKGSIAEQLGISRAQLYTDWRAALWFFKGVFETAGIPMLASPKRPRPAKGIW